ncbi:hypothetical protein CRV24_009597 [Beauveria bassiana]|nr:hypothetical protein CRV24_009597 [Beauveria bassiana]KAH8707873.1 hypothetical protein HC256_010035 [Beauveria bassiana]
MREYKGVSLTPHFVDNSRLITTIQESLVNMSAVADDDSIKVYCTVTGFTEDAICELLRSDVLSTVEEVKEQFTVKFVPGQRPLRIVKHQRDNYKVPDYSDQSYFLIVDSVNAATDGVLLCDLEAEHGFPDAVRNMPDMASMTAASLGIANSDWTEVREGTWQEQQPPVRRLAVYDNRTNGDRDSFHQLANAVDVGLHYVNDEGDPPSLGSIDDLFRYVAISLEQSYDKDELIGQHQRYAEEKGLDSNRLAVVDDKYADEGALLIQVEPQKKLRCKPPVAGELLYWNAIGFMDWEEIEEFASKHSDFEQSRHTRDTEGQQNTEERRLRYYRTRLGMVIASMNSQEIPTNFTRSRQGSEGVDEFGEKGPVQDTIVEELPWDYYLTKNAAEEDG